MSSPQNCHFRGDMGEPAPCQGHISPSNTQAGVGLKGVPLSPQITKSHQKGEQLFFLNVLNSDSQATDTQKRLNDCLRGRPHPRSSYTLVTLATLLLETHARSQQGDSFSQENRNGGKWNPEKTTLEKHV